MKKPASTPLPAWVDIVITPLFNVGIALFAAGLIIWSIGENPFEALNLLVLGALSDGYGLGYTLYYTTNFIFTGLAVAVAFHAGLFNIGGEGQAYIGGLGLGLAVLATDSFLPFWLLWPLGLMACGLAGAAWAYIPGRLQATRGSHIVITTIMFNFIAAALMVYLMAHILIEPGQMSPESRSFKAAGHLLFLHEIAPWFGMSIVNTPLNIAIFWALLCCVFVWFFLWHTRWGYAIRALGQNEKAAIYAGIDPKKITVMTLCFSGMLAGFMSFNELMGVHHKLLLNFTAGYGFTGIAVSLMGRNHPAGIVVASLLFGILYQGGAELSFSMPTITREMVVTIQGLIILFCGALSLMSKPLIDSVFRRLLYAR